MRLGAGSPSIDFNGTRYTSIEGSAADSRISLQRKFDPLKQPGIALTTQQARSLGVKVGDTVQVRDTKTGKAVEATFYDSAGGRRKNPLDHFEVSPALADQLGINYRNKNGKVVDAVTNREPLAGRFAIERAGSTAATPTTPSSFSNASTSSATSTSTATRLGAFDNRYRAEPSASAIESGKASLRIGDRGESVKALQRKLGVKDDGFFGPITQRALAKAQQGLGMKNDAPGFGTADKAMMDRIPQRAPSRRSTDRTPATEETAATTSRGNTDSPNNLRAQFDRTEKAGQRNQLKTGKITINGNTYEFNSGGWGRGNLPTGKYTVSGGVRTSESGMVRDGVGFKFNLSNKYDPRVGGEARSGLLIHPDGGVRGTMGCIGIVGNGDVQRRFYQDMRAELARHGGSFSLNVG